MTLNIIFQTDGILFSVIGDWSLFGYWCLEFGNLLPLGKSQSDYTIRSR